MLKSIGLNILTFLSIASLLLYGACASQKKNFFSKTYHNTTAKYNSYFIANEDIAAVETAIKDDQQNNYNKILGVFYDIDSATINTERAQLEDAIVKASLSIQRHENSNWVYPSYYLIGKARYYGGDFENAIITFKYIIKHSEDKDVRHQASVALMRTFIDYNEHNNAVAVADYLRKENLDKLNTRDFLLTKAYLFQLRGDYESLALNLSQAVEIEPFKKNKARYYFILGQVYQHLGVEESAYTNYKKCLRSNPEYELSFYAKLNLAQVTKVGKKVDLKQIRKYFKRLLKDEKNREFVDRIYYEMANFELNHDNPDLAVSYLKSSVAESQNNPRQKGYAYLKLGELYYDFYKDYELAQAYYDSTVTVLPSDEEGFEAIKERSVVLNDFVKQLNTIQLQDSLLALSALSSEELQKVLKKAAEDQERLEKDKEKEARRKARSIASTGSGITAGGMDNSFGTESAGTGSNDTWYFYNSAVVASGKSQFVSIWGNRPLADNWRTSQGAGPGDFAQQEMNSVPEDSVSTEKPAKKIPESEELTAAYMKTIPFTEEEKSAALKKIEDAYFVLGDIYNFQLDEKENAVQTFEKLLNRFPGSEYEAETLYLLYLLYKPVNAAKAESYKQTLVDNYPKTIFAKLAVNPNYKEESNETSERLQRLYKIAYGYYMQEDYNQAKLLVNRGLEQYPDNDFSDQLKILGILADGKIEGQYKYQYELQQFIENNPESKLLEYAKNLLETSKDFKVKEQQRMGVQYIAYFEQPHFFIFVYPNLGGFSEIIPALIENFIEQKYASLNLKTGNLSMNEGYSLVLVNKFDTKESAMNFYEDFNKSDIQLPEDEKITFEDFVITEDNFQIFYQTKQLEDYLKFFEEYYKVK